MKIFCFEMFWISFFLVIDPPVEEKSKLSCLCFWAIPGIQELLGRVEFRLLMPLCFVADTTLSLPKEFLRGFWALLFIACSI